MHKIIVCFLILGFFTAQPVYAAKKRIVSKKATTSKNVAPASAGSFSSARLSRATNSIIVSFKNLEKVSRIDYELVYNANGVSQGAMGSVTPNGSTDSRDLYFGTCSKGVCTPHRNIKNATLTIRTQLNNGGTNTKRYKIKI